MNENHEEVAKKTPLKSPQKTLSLEERELLIASYPIFCLLNEKDIHHLALLTKEKYLDENVIITREGDIVDSVYLISSGNAEVSRFFSTMEENQTIHIATLTKGDAIGLGESGFFSPKGIRTATVTSSSPMVLLVIDLVDFQHFLQNSEVPYPGLKNVGEKILLMNFLNDMHLFNNFSKEMIIQLVKRVKKISAPKDTILFKQGDIADTCFFIISGTVTIYTTNDNSVHVLKELVAFKMFGEGAFIDEGRRNASARTETNCELFVLEKESIKQVTNEANESFSKSLATLRIEQIRPTKRVDISVIKTKSPEDEDVLLLHNPSHNTKLRLGKIDNALWEKIDGKKTLGNILEEVKGQFSNLALTDIYAHVTQLVEAGFIEFPQTELIRVNKSNGILKSIAHSFKKLWKKG